MTPLMTISLVLRIIAVIWAGLLLARLRDARVAIVFAVYIVTAGRHAGIMADWSPNDPSPLYGSFAEWTSFAVSVLILVILPMMRELILRERAALSASDESRTRYRALFELGPDSVIVARLAEDGMPGEIIDLNERTTELFGYSREELLGRSIVDFDARAHEVRERVHRVSPDGYLTFETEWICKDGSQVPTEISIRALDLPDGPVVIGAARSLSGERKTAYELRLAGERLARAEKLAKLGTVEWSADYGTVSVSQNLYDVLGLGDKRLADDFSVYLDRIHPDDRDRANEAYRRLLEDHENVSITHRLLVDGGEDRVISISAMLIGESESDPTFLITFQDVTDDQRRQAALTEANDRFEQLAANIDQGFFLYGVDDAELLYVSPMWERISGYKGDQLTSLPWGILDIIHPDDRQYMDAAFRKGGRVLGRDGSDLGKIEVRIQRQDGESRWIEVKSFALRDPLTGKQRVAGVITDVTDVRHSRDALITANAELSHAQRLAEIGHAEIDMVHGSATWSPRLSEMLGIDHVEGEKSALALFESVHPDDRVAARESVAALAKTHNAGSFETRVVWPDGTIRSIEISCEPIGEKESPNKRIRAISQDVTERRQLERLLRSLATVTALAEEAERHRIAAELHDGAIQNLGMCRVRLGQLKAELAQSPHSPLLEEITQLVDLSIHEARSILSEISPPVLNELGLVAAVEWLADLIADRSGIAYRVEATPESISLNHDLEVLMFQTVRELCVNAEKHSGATRCDVELSADDERLSVVVADDGNGMMNPDEQMVPTEHGGFGLFSIRERVRLLGGSMAVESTERGTRLQIDLPLRTANALLADDRIEPAA